jgi:hypothetical protein
MAVNVNDMNELRRIVTNSYDYDKACIQRIIRGIEALNAEVQALKTENKKLTEQLKV